jgi:hypothetical protein
MFTTNLAIGSHACCRILIPFTCVLFAVNLTPKTKPTGKGKAAAARIRINCRFLLAGLLYWYGSVRNSKDMYSYSS